MILVAERVQALAVGGLKELSDQFIRPAHERPKNSKAVEGVTGLSSPYLSRTRWSSRKWLRRARNGGYCSYDSIWAHCCSPYWEYKSVAEEYIYGRCATCLN